MQVLLKTRNLCNNRQLSQLPDSAQYPSYRHSDDSDDSVIFDYKSVLWINFSVRINKCVYEILSKLPCVGILNYRLKLKLLSGRHWMFVSFLEHTGSVLQNSEHLLMSSQSRGYLTAQTGLDTRWIIFCMLWFYFWKNLIAFGDLNKLSCGGLSMYFLTLISFRCFSSFSKTKDHSLIVKCLS